MFDDDDRVAEAIAVCRSCPALEACEAWITGLPAARRPGGVVAGKHRAVPTFRVHAGTSTVAQRISALASRGPISVTTVAEQLGISANRAAVEVRRHKGLRRVSRGVYEATG